MKGSGALAPGELPTPAGSRGSNFPVQDAKN